MASTQTDATPHGEVSGNFGIVGILAGMGPLATIDFMQKVIPIRRRQGARSTYRSSSRRSRRSLIARQPGKGRASRRRTP